MVTKEQEAAILSALKKRFNMVSLRADTGEIYVLSYEEMPRGWRYFGHIDNPQILEAE